MPSNISAESALQSYTLFNATDIKNFIIQQLEKSENNAFGGCSYLGANMNAFVDSLAVLLQQILFHFSVNTSEASFTTASLYESMNKLVGLLNYKTMGKQTSMLPVKFVVDVATLINDRSDSSSKPSQITIPRFTQCSYNSTYYLKNEIIIPITKDTPDFVEIDAVLHEGQLHENSSFVSNGDEFETFIIVDRHIKNGSRFVSDNFFMVFVDEDGNNQWKEYFETMSLFSNDENALVYEKRFNEDYNYEFKFGNGTNGKKLKKGARVAIFFLISNGESGILGDDIISEGNPVAYSSSLYNSILKSSYSTIDKNSYGVDYIVSVQNTGNGTAISYPESVESIRQNAPRIFASQNRLFSLVDYDTFIKKNYGAYIKDSYFCTNDTYTREFLRYYYDIGLDSPQKDSRINLAQVQFMSSTNFNNIYCFLVPKVNTIISGKVPNYINTTIKQEIVNSVEEYKGYTHNIVVLDPIYRAFTFGYFMDDDNFNANQLENKLLLIRNRFSKYSYSFIKDYAVTQLKNYFNTLKLGSEIDLAQITKIINSIPGVKKFYIMNSLGDLESKMTIYHWNPLYSNEDNNTTQQNISLESFVYPYFYNINNIDNLIEIQDES